MISMLITNKMPKSKISARKDLERQNCTSLGRGKNDHSPNQKKIKAGRKIGDVNATTVRSGKFITSFNWRNSISAREFGIRRCERICNSAINSSRFSETQYGRIINTPHQAEIMITQQPNALSKAHTEVLVAVARWTQITINIEASK